MTSKSLEYYVGKVCTIITGTINRNFQEKQLLDHFVGIVESVDNHGIQTIHTTTGCKNFYFFPNIYSIHEEQVLDPNDPEDAKLIEEMKAMKSQRKQPSAPTPPPPLEDVHQKQVNNSPFVDVDSIKALAKRAKQTIGNK